jgi:hypothetical protein
MEGRGGRQNWYATGTRFGGEVFGPLFMGARREVSPIHYRSDGKRTEKTAVFYALVTAFKSISVLVEPFQTEKTCLFK